MASEFELAVDEAKRLERKVASYTPYKSKVEIARTLDLEPKEYVDLNYGDLLNMYERTEKILSTMGMLRAATGKAPEAQPTAPLSAKSEEVESKLKEMTTEVLQKADEMGKEPITAAPIEKETAPAEAIVKPAPEIEIEKEPAKMEIEFEERETKGALEIERHVREEEQKIEKELEPETEKPPQLEKAEGEPAAIEREKREETKAPSMHEPEPQAQPAQTALPPQEKKIMLAAVPPALRESPDEAASKRFAKIEEQIMATMGGATDEVSLKRKMLELTKDLFKEKSINRREQIKLEITVLKNMLLATQEGGGRKKTKKDAASAAHGQVLDTLINAEEAEVSQTKDTIIDSYKRQITQTRDKFYNELGSTEDTAARKRTLDTFLFSLTALLEQMPDVIKNYEDFAAKKHVSELEKLLSSLDGSEKDVDKRAKERIEFVKKGYSAEFSVVKAIIGRDIDNLMDEAALAVFSKGEEGPEAHKGSKDREIISEINKTDDRTLLSYLSSKDNERYKSYEHKRISRAEALMSAKALLAKEKGLPADMISKQYGLGAV